MSSLPKVPGSDDEEDLNALRIAALQSLKRKDGPDTMGLQTNENMLFENSGNFRSHKGHRNKKGRFLVAFSSRGGKPPHFNRDFSRSRNTNLIAITTIPNESESNKTQNNQEIISTEEKEISKDDINSKFSRYNNSDKSESESDVEQQQHLSGEEGNPGKLKRSNSLEALMLELDNEIKGKPIEEKEVKVRMKNSCESESHVISDNADKTKVQVENIVTCTNSDKLNEDSTNSSQEITESVRNIYHRELNHVRRKRVKTHRRFLQRHMPQINMFNEGPNNSPGQIIFGPPLPFHPPLIPFPNQPFNSYGPPVMSMPNQLPQPFYTRPLSPLAINTESLTTATLAPLSPRSAAFVLQNKAIIERRKRSPRRSYSRSLSRSPRRSPISPRRSPISPRRSPISPKRTSRSPRRSPRRQSLSPRRRSLSPYRRSISPRRRKAVRNEPLLKNRLAIRERLGAKTCKVGEDKDKAYDIVKDNDSLSKDDIQSPNKEDKPTRVEKILDPVFEARRKKFESNEIKKKEGIIRLKPKGDNKDVVSSSDEINKQSTVLPPIASSLPKKIGCVKEVKLEKEQTIKKIVQDYKKEEKPNNKDEQINKEEKCIKVEEKLLKTPVSNSPDKKNMKKEINTDVKVPDEFEELEKLLNDNPLPEIDDILQPKVADIFSDEDSGSDNEGRFKATQKDANKVSVIPFTKLRSSTGSNIKTDLSLPLRPARRSRHEPITESSFRRRNRTRVSETRKSPKRETIKNETKKSIPQDKLPVKNRITIRRDRYTPPLDRKFERKIEIKIKNPSKYEKSGKSWSLSKGSPDNIQIKEELVENDVRAVELDEIEPEIIIENDSEDEENSTTNEGDLRAQLSKKRAEKLHRIPVTTVSSRLLKYALEGAVFTKSKKKKSKEKKETLKKDVRVPIHLRLGIANSSDILTDTHVKRKSRKRKSGKVLEQV